MFEKVSTDLNFVSREVEIEKFWRENDIFQKSVDQREGSDVFMFYDGPPTANGKPHIGHIETRAIKSWIAVSVTAFHIRRIRGTDIVNVE